MFDNYDDQDPWGYTPPWEPPPPQQQNLQSQYGNTDLGTTLAPGPLNYAWSPEEFTGAIDWANNYVGQNSIDPSWGNANDMLERYKQYRQQGMSDAEARGRIPGDLGWDKGGGGGAVDTGSGNNTNRGGPGGGGPMYGFGPSLGNLFAPFTGQAPDPSMYRYTPTDAPAFHAVPYNRVAPFKAPTGEEAKADPGYDLRRQMGEQEITNNRATSGLLRGGATLKDLMNYNQNYAANEYGQVYNRRANEWGMNEQDYNQAWDRQEKGAEAEYAPQLAGWQTNTANGQRAAELGWQQAFQTWQQNFDIDKFNKQWPYTVLSDQQNKGLTAAMNQ